MKSVNIFAVSNGVGITRDITILKDTLVSAGFEVACNHTFRYEPKRRYDINLWLERFDPAWFTMADKNIFVPNQEWFEPTWHQFLPAFDYIFAKTRYAEKIFNDLKCQTIYTGFTSEDRYLPSVKKDDFHFIHVVGKSIQKQTEIVVRTWARNPGFPNLTVVQDPKFYRPRALLRNVTFMYDRLPDATLKHIQNEYAVHLCPSETEGFGHYIMEALSCKATVLVTNAAPMTELVTPETGLFIEPVRTAPMRLSTKHIISEQTLEDAVAKVFVLDDAKRREMGERAREFYLQNDAAFKKRLVEAITSVA